MHTINPPAGKINRATRQLGPLFFWFRQRTTNQPRRQRRRRRRLVPQLSWPQRVAFGSTSHRIRSHNCQLSQLTMSETNVEQMISHLGLSREEFSKRLLQMREFMGQGSASFAPQETGTASRGRSASASRTSVARSISRQSSRALRDASPTRAGTPVKAEPVEQTLPGSRQRDSMDIVLEQQRRARRDKRGNRGRTHNPSPPPGATRTPAGGEGGADGQQGASSVKVEVRGIFASS